MLKGLSLCNRISLLKSERLRHRFEFRHLYEIGRKVIGCYAVVYASEYKTSRGNHLVGFVASSKIGCAVERNRAKRLLREVYRLNRQKLKNNTQIVLIARVAIREKSYREVEVDVLSLFQRVKILRQIR